MESLLLLEAGARTHRSSYRWRPVWLRACVALLLSSTGLSSAGLSLTVAGEPAQPRPAKVAGNFDDEEAMLPEFGITTVKPGTSTTAVRKQTIAEFPWQRLDEQGTQKAQQVLRHLGLYRHLPTLSFEVDPQVYRYYVENPDVAVGTWRVMEVSRFQLEQTSPTTYRADAGDGSTGTVELLYSTPEDTLIYCDGAFKSPLLIKPVQARALIRVQTQFSVNNEGRPQATHQGDVFVEFPSVAVETVAKLISPVSYSIADKNFKQLTLFATMMSFAMVKHPGWIESVSNRLDGISEARRHEFLQLAAESHVAGRKRMKLPPIRQVALTPDELLEPFRESLSGEEDPKESHPIKSSNPPVNRPPRR